MRAIVVQGIHQRVVEHGNELSRNSYGDQVYLGDSTLEFLVCSVEDHGPVPDMRSTERARDLR